MPPKSRASLAERPAPAMSGGSGRGGKGRGRARAGSTPAASPPAESQAGDLRGGAASVAGDAEGVADEAAQGSGSKRRRPAQACFACGCDAVANPWAAYGRVKGEEKPVGPGCLECQKTHAAAFRLQCTFDDAMERCRTDGEFKKQFLAAHQIRLGKSAASHDVSAVGSVQEGGYRATRFFVGYSLAEFEQVYGKRPRDLKLPVVDLPNELGVKYRGVLLQCPDRPGTHYEVFTNVFIGKTRQDLTPAQHLRSGQDTEQYDNSYANINQKGSTLQRLRTCTLTDAAITQMVAKLDEQQDADDKTADAQGQDAAECEGDDWQVEDDEAEDDDIEDGEKKSGHSLYAASAAPSLYGGAADVIGSPGPSQLRRLTARSCFGGSESRWGDDRSGGEDQPSAKKRKHNTEEWIDKLCVMKILGGAALRRERNFAIKHLEELADVGKKALLQDHMEVVDNALAIIDSDLSTISDAKLAHHMEPCLKHLAGALPTNLKVQLFLRFVGAGLGPRIVSSGRDTTQQLLAVITPWAHPESQQTETFKWQLPALSMIEGPLAELASLFRQGVEGILVHLTQGGEGLREKTLEFCHDCLNFFAPSLAEDLVDEYMEILADVCVCCRGLLCLLDPEERQHTKSCSTLLARPTRAKAVALPASVKAVISRQSLYAALIEDFNSRGASTVVHWGAYEACVKALAAETIDITTLKDCVAQYTVVEAKMRKGLAEKIADKLADQIGYTFNDMKELVRDGAGLSATDRKNKLELYERLFEEVASHMMSVVPTVHTMKDEVAKALAQVALESDWDVFSSSVDKLLDVDKLSALEAHDDRANLQRLGNRLMAAIGGSRLRPPEVTQKVEGLLIKTLEQAAQVSDVSGAGMGELVDLGLTCADVLKLSAEHASRRHLRLFHDVRSLALGLDEYMPEGRSVSDAVARDTGASTLAELSSMLQLIRCEDGEDAFSLGDGTSKFLTEAQETVKTSVEYVMDKHTQTVKAQTDELTSLCAPANIGLTIDWKDGLGADFSFDQLAGHATKTLLNISGDAMQAAALKMKTLTSDMKRDSERFASDVGEAVLKDGITMVDKCELVSKEALILMAFKDLSSDPKRLRKVLLVERKDMPVLKFCSVMSDAIEDAIQLR